MKTMPFLLLTALALLTLLGVSCSDSADSDAYGNFEATEVTVSAQADGRLLTFTVNEGDQLAEGDAVGLVDTTQLAAQRDNLLAQRRNLLGQQRALRAQERAARSQVAEARAQTTAMTVQLATATEERDRTRRLAADNAATGRELNEREGAVDQLAAQVSQAEARTTTVQAQTQVYAAQASALDDQIAGIDAQVRQLADRLANTTLVNTRAGTVLTVLARGGEVVRGGSPLYTVADLDPLTLRAYATGNQLPRLRVGMSVDVLIDDGAGGLERRDGTVTFIAPQAEFTPTPIQTRDERAELVYAFEVRTPNADGRLKIGMPGEVRFPATTDGPSR